MKHHSTKNIAVAGVTMLALACTSCDSMDDASLTVAQGTAIGAVVGAGIGAGIGALASSKGNRGDGVAIGAVVGGLIGASLGQAWGEYVVYEKSYYASQEAYLNANITMVRKRVGDVRRTNHTLEKEIAKLKASQTVDKNRVEIIRQNVQKRKELINKDIATANKALRSGNASNINELREQVSQLSQERKMMEERMATLSNLARKA